MCRTRQELVRGHDIGRGAGIYGTSAGGQSAMGALLFHPDFYTAAVSSCGCHDNRMDKIGWNEQRMGWPIGPWYAESSNMENAWRLEGDLLLIVGEMDTNVDPSSTLQVMDALIEAEKDFDLLVLPGRDTPAGAPTGNAAAISSCATCWEWNRPIGTRESRARPSGPPHRGPARVAVVRLAEPVPFLGEVVHRTGQVGTVLGEGPGERLPAGGPQVLCPQGREGSNGRF